MAKALHARTDDDCHLPAINKLRVLLFEREDGWFAQGVDLDYAATGRTLEEVQQHFEQGLAATINRHLQRFDSIEHLLKYPPEAEWKALKEPRAYDIDLVTWHEMGDSLMPLPFDGIAYLPVTHAATA
ncbi:hypothetical protein [Allochromatium tepidum]|uniref:Uncharacterized protein n=1 Tax=Allochromatium tepidum TaxID=553982 RepID=A0ABM7QMY1_9GAMM|nr:hypothetical protein [Allochromatium tepidum]BCU07190.1 hypothetical protein Atep_18670 [Allochromatium tepidum]